MSDGPDIDSKVAWQKLCTFANSIKITQNNIIFSYFIKL